MSTDDPAAMPPFVSHPFTMERLHRLTRRATTGRNLETIEEMNEFLGEKFELSPTRLGIDMRKIYDRVGGVDKHVGPLYNTYTLDAQKCMEFLKRKNWWVQ